MWQIWEYSQNNHFSVIKRFVCILIKTLGCKRRNETIVNLFQKTAARLPDKTMMTLCSESGDTSMTFRECLDKSLRIAHYFRNAGYVQVGGKVKIFVCSVNLQSMTFSGRHCVHCNGEQTGLLLLLDGSRDGRSNSRANQQQSQTGNRNPKCL